MHRLRVRGLLREIEMQDAPPPEVRRHGDFSFSLAAACRRFEYVDTLTQPVRDRRIVDGLLDMVESATAENEEEGRLPRLTGFAAAKKEAEEEWMRWNRRGQRHYWV